MINPMAMVTHLFLPTFILADRPAVGVPDGIAPKVMDAPAVGGPVFSALIVGVCRASATFLANEFAFLQCREKHAAFTRPLCCRLYLVWAT
jgi:hypothetical protein